MKLNKYLRHVTETKKCRTMLKSVRQVF